MALMGDARFLPDLFAQLRESKPGDDSWRDQVAFLQELCGLAKHLQAMHRMQLLNKLSGLGLFEVGQHPSIFEVRNEGYPAHLSTGACRV
jgi:protein phosphatase-4 regulatory subunit 3